jgi:adenosine deaminase
MDYDTPGFRTFLDKFKVFRGFYPCREAIASIAYTAVREAAEDSVKYLELRYSPSHFASRNKFEEADVIIWIQEAIQKAAVDFDIIVIPLVTISRDYGFDLAKNTVEHVAGLAPGFFYGLDIAGDEISNPAKPFAELFALARRAGLQLTIHAGEACGPANVREAVLEYHAARIGHGVRSVEDPAVMALLRERDIMLEICLTSNLHTGVVPTLKQHPIKTLMAHGIPVSLNTDDPAISGITLTGEYVAAVTRLGFTEDDLKALNRSALDHAFHPDRKKLKEKLLHYWE